MSLETTAGKASVRLVCSLFNISRQAYYDAKAAAEGRPRGADPAQELGEEPVQLAPLALAESTSASGAGDGAEGPLRASEGSAPPMSDAQPEVMRGGREVTAAELESSIRAIVAEHPAWGVWEVWATLRQPKYGLKVSKKRSGRS